MPWEQLKHISSVFLHSTFDLWKQKLSKLWKKQGFSEGKKLVIKPTVFWSWFEYYMYFWLSSLTGLNLQELKGNMVCI